MVGYWDALSAVLPALSKLDLERRKAVRKKSVATPRNVLNAFVALAYTMKDTGTSLDALRAARDEMAARRARGLLLQPRDPIWEADGVLVRGEKVLPDGTRTLAMRNSRQSRNAIPRGSLQQVGLENGLQSAGRARASLRRLQRPNIGRRNTGAAAKVPATLDVVLRPTPFVTRSYRRTSARSRILLCRHVLHSLSQLGCRVTGKGLRYRS